MPDVCRERPRIAVADPILTTRRCFAEYESGVCYVLDGEVGDDPGALSNGDHRTPSDQLIALGVDDQPASITLSASGQR